jgi:hypothetical protein
LEWNEEWHKRIENIIQVECELELLKGLLVKSFLGRLVGRVNKGQLGGMGRIKGLFLLNLLVRNKDEKGFFLCYF